MKRVQIFFELYNYTLVLFSLTLLSLYYFLNSFFFFPENSDQFIDWWTFQDPKYDQLKLMAYDFLTIQPTSVPSERSFSV